MKKLLTEIQDGTFARNFIEENKTGRKKFDDFTNFGRLSASISTA